MPLDEATTQFAFLMQRDTRRFTEREEQRAQRGEDVKYDSVSRLATFETRRGGVAGRLFGEPLASYATDDRILRWAWAGRSNQAEVTHADVVFREGQAHGIAQLTMSLVSDLDEGEAMTLARLGALVARADALHVRRSGTHLEFIGLFERPRPWSSGPDSRFSVPPPPVREKASDTPPPQRVPYRSLPPIREIFAPRTGSRPPGAVHFDAAHTDAAEAKVREPARQLFLPVANAMLAALARGCRGYKQGLFVVAVDERGPRRIIVHLVALDAHGDMRALDAPTELLDVAAHLVDADRADGNGPWRKLVVRVSPKHDGGATLHVDVV